MDVQPISWDLGEGLQLEHMRPEHAGQLEALQRIVFPTLAPDELIRAEHYLRHLELFPEGQFVVVRGASVIAMTSTMRTTFDFTDYHHTFKETIAGGWMTNHDPSGDWLYGLDMGVHPDFRGRGLARQLYRARQTVAAALGLKGQLTVGMLSGYGAVSGQMSGEECYRLLLEGKLNDPTISTQMKIGFEPVALIPNYLNDPVCGNYGVLLRLDIGKRL